MFSNPKKNIFQKSQNPNFPFHEENVFQRGNGRDPKIFSQKVWIPTSIILFQRELQKSFFQKRRTIPTMGNIILKRPVRLRFSVFGVFCPLPLQFECAQTAQELQPGHDVPKMPTPPPK